LWLGKAYHCLEQAIGRISIIINSAGMMSVVFIMLLVTVDVLMRNTFSRPILGAYELVELLMAIFVSLALAYTGVQKGHVSVDVVVSRFSPRVRTAIMSFNWLASSGLFLLVSWKTLENAETLREAGLVSPMLFVPAFPFALVLALGSGLLSLVFLIQFIESVSRVVRR